MRMAIAASLVARMSGIALQVVSLPIAAAALSSGGFAVYSIAAAILGWLSLSSFGIGPALTVRVSAAIGQGDDLLAKNQFATGAFIMLAITALVTLTLVGLMEFSNFSSDMFAKTGISHRDSYQILYALIAIFCVTTAMLAFESAQLSMQESYFLNGYTAAGTLLAAIATFYVSKTDPTPLKILLAIQMPMLVARFINVVHFSWRHKSLVGGVLNPKMMQVRAFFIEGMHFFLSGSVANFLAHVFPILLIGTLASPEYTSATAAVMNAIIILASFFSLANQPLLGALPEALARDDRAWISRAYRLTLSVNVAFAAGVFAIFSLMGVPLFDFWYQGTIHPSSGMLMFAGVYLLFLAFDVSHFTFLAGCGRLASASFILLVRTSVYAVALYIFAKADMGELPFALLALSCCTLSLIPLALKWRQWFKQP
jgi:O-antigen/teichoic acid export membrane protein